MLLLVESTGSTSYYLRRMNEAKIRDQRRSCKRPPIWPLPSFQDRRAIERGLRLSLPHNPFTRPLSRRSARPASALCSRRRPPPRARRAARGRAPYYQLVLRTCTAVVDCVLSALLSAACCLPSPLGDDSTPLPCPALPTLVLLGSRVHIATATGVSAACSWLNHYFCTNNDTRTR